MIPILGLTWCIPCVTIAKGDISTSPSDSTSSAASTISVSGIRSEIRSDSKSGSCSTVIKTVATTSTSNSVITLKQNRSGSLTSNCSHALKCTSVSAATGSNNLSNFCENDFTKNNGGHLLCSSNNNINKTSNTSEFNKLRPCIKHNPSKNKLSYSYDDLLSVSNSTSSGTGTTSYGFVSRPSALKRSSSTNNRPNNITNNNNNNKSNKITRETRETSSDSNTNNQRYSTNSLCSNKSVKFNLPLIQHQQQQHQFHEKFRENCDFTKKNNVESGSGAGAAVGSCVGVVVNPDDVNNLTEKKFLNHMSSYFFRGPISTSTTSGFPPGSYFMYQNYCTNCGMCPFSGTGNHGRPVRPEVLANPNPASTATSNFQLATWFQTQNFYQFHQQQQHNNDESGPFLLSLINIVILHVISTITYHSSEIRGLCLMK